MVCTACFAVNVSCISGRSKILAVEAVTLTCTACLVLVDYYLAWPACFVLSMSPLQALLLKWIILQTNVPWEIYFSYIHSCTMG